MYLYLYVLVCICIWRGHWVVVGRDNTPFCKSTSCSHSSHGQWHAFNSGLAWNIQTWEHWCTLSFNSLLDHRDNYCSAVGCYKIVQCYLVSQVQNNCCPTKRQCVAQCKQFNSLPPTADELFSLLWGSGASLSIATSFNPSWVASSLFQQNLNPNHQDCWKVGLWQRSGGAVAFF